MTKPNQGTIFVPKGIVPVHSFDLWGPVIDAKLLGERKINLYRDWMSDEPHPIDEEHTTHMNQVIADYQALIDGEAWALGERKGEIINALESVVRASETPINYDGVFQEDGLYVLNEILDAGEEAIIFTSKPAPWLKPNMPKEISERLGEVYADKKTDPEAFKRVYAAEASRNRQVITHTADEMPELEAAVKTGLFQKEGLIYINRNNTNGMDTVLAAGVGQYVNSLQDVNYTRLAQTQ